ncbi:17.6 kDa class I heat shock protein 3-like protein [Drosera capensis]
MWWFSSSSCARLGGSVTFVPYANVEIISLVPARNRRANCDSSFTCGASGSGSGLGYFKAPADWKETPEAHVFMVDLPGTTKEEVKVEVVDEGRVLQISGERSEEEEEIGVRHRVERGRGKFVRRFRLPRNVEVEDVKAEMEDGVLTVTVPKVEEKKPETKPVEISG